jgi:hypothetical protein
LPAPAPPLAPLSYGSPTLLDISMVSQSVTTVEATAGQDYSFSVWVAPATPNWGAVYLEMVFRNSAGGETIGGYAESIPSGGGWVSAAYGMPCPYTGLVTIEVRLYSWSYVAGWGGAEKFWAWGAQLNAYDMSDPYEPTMGSISFSTVDPGHAVTGDCSATLDATNHVVAIDEPPMDWEGDVFRTAFSVTCKDGTGPLSVVDALAVACTSVDYIRNGRVRCTGSAADVRIGDLLCSGTRPDGEAYGGVDYYEIPFSFHQAAITEGDLFAEESFATGNYNYRIDRVALNIVGTNVRNCALSDYPDGCYSRAVTPYSLAQGGGVSVRNYRGADVGFSMPAAWIHHGKALAAERVITTPITSGDSALLTDLYRSEFRGRPVEGTYTLRLHQTDALDFDALEDIQLILYYRYWSASDMSKSTRGWPSVDPEEE